MRGLAKTITVLTVLLAAVPQLQALEADDLRAYAIKQDSFDYVFTSVVKNQGADSRLSLNDRYGRTFFVSVGDTVGDYRVCDFKPATTRIFKPSVNRTIEEPSGTLFLEAPDGTSIPMERQVRPKQSGLRANFVLLHTGMRFSGRAGDSLTIDGSIIVISNITETDVRVSIDGRDTQVDMLTLEETAQVTALLQKQRAAREAQLQLAQQQRMEREQQYKAAQQRARERRKQLLAERRNEVQMAKVSHRTPMALRSPRAFYGTEYRYPTAYRVLPPTFNPYGHVVFPGMVIPTGFTTRTTGIGCNSYAYPYYYASGLHGQHGQAMHRGGGGLSITIGGNVGF